MLKFVVTVPTKQTARIKRLHLLGVECYKNISCEAERAAIGDVLIATAKIIDWVEAEPKAAAKSSVVSKSKTPGIAGVFTDDEWAKFFLAMHSTWQAIGSDVAQTCHECGERLTNLAAIESVLDCDRMQMYGGRREVGGDEAQALVTKLFASRFKYTTILRYLAVKIRLA